MTVHKNKHGEITLMVDREEAQEVKKVLKENGFALSGETEVIEGTGGGDLEYFVSPADADKLKATLEGKVNEVDYHED